MGTVFRIANVLGCFFCGTAIVVAHPGHGEPGPLHYLSEADHVVPVLISSAAILCGLIAVKWIRSRRSGLPAVATVKEKASTR